MNLRTARRSFPHLGFPRFGVVVLAGVLVGPLLTGGIAHAARNAATAAPPATIDKAALGSGGGPFCDLAREQLTITLGPGANAIVSGDVKKAKAFVETATALNKKMAAAAPREMKAAVAAALKSSTAVNAALVKANYDFRKIDTAALAKVTSDPAVAAAGKTTNEYYKRVCHIDVNKLFGLQAAPAK